MTEREPRRQRRNHSYWLGEENDNQAAGPPETGKEASLIVETRNATKHVTFGRDKIVKL